MSNNNNTYPGYIVMGNKYASIHIRTNDREMDLEKYLSLQKNEKPVFDRQKALANLLEKPEDRDNITRFLGLITKSVLIILTHDFITISDENESFESIEKKAKRLSQQIDNPIVFTSNFDDDIFVFGACNSGKCVTKGIAGKNPGSYGLKNKAINTDIFRETVSTDNLDIRSGLESFDIKEIEKTLEDYLHIPLGLKASDIGFDYENYPDVISGEGYMLLRLNN